MKYYFGPYQQAPAHPGMMAWTPPPGSTCAIDLRNIPAHDIKAPPALGVFALPDDRTLGADYNLIGAGLGHEIMPANRSIFASAFGVRTVTGDSLADWLWDLFTVRADPTGDDRCKPIMPGHSGQMELILGYRLKSRKFDPVADECAAALDRLRRQYRDNLEAAGRGEFSDPEHHRRILDYTGKKLGIKDPQDILIPDDLPKVAPLPHATTYTESFNTSDGDTLGPDLSWTELHGDIDIVSNKARLETIGGTYGGFARADHDLSSDDHYAQSTVRSGATDDFPLCMLVARKDSTATMTYYVGYFRFNAINNVQIYKVVAGSFTSIAGPTSMTLSQTTDYVGKLKCSGSTISQEVDAVEKHSATDSAIDNRYRCAINAYQHFSVVSMTHDAFTAADLAAGSGIVFMMHSPLLGGGGNIGGRVG